MLRREFLGGCCSAAAWPVVVRAQQPIPVVGFCHIGSRDGLSHLTVGFRQGLAESNFVEGRNVAVEYRWANGQRDRLPALVADLMRRQVRVIVGNSQMALAAKSTGATIPVVFVSGDDPVKLGLVESLNRPGGTMTGVYLFTVALEAKRLGLLRDVVPNAKTIAVLVDQSFLRADIQARDVQEAGARLGVQIVIVRTNPQVELDTAFAIFVERQVAALLVCASPLFYSKRNQLIALAAKYKLPAIYEWREFAEAGGLISYNNSIVDSYRQTGVYAGRILHGAKPADLPVVQPTKFELVVNARTARTLGITISDNLLLLADQVIE
jgi:putative ABC transport system substrate-binding protein